MGMDAEIWVRLRKGSSFDDARRATGIGDALFTFRAANDDERTWMPPDSEWAVAESSAVRYFGDGYERGWWPYIAAVLLDLMACQHVDTVWYSSDTLMGDEIVKLEPFTMARFQELCVLWVGRCRENPGQHSP